MQYPTRHVSRTRPVLILAAAAVMLLLLCSAHASAEGANPVVKLVASTEEAVTSTQAAAPPEPVAPVVEDPEPVQAEPAVTTDVTPDAVVREAPTPSPPAHPLSTRAPNPTPAAITDSALRKGAAATPSTDRVPNLTRRVSPDPAETTAAVVHLAAETAAASTDPLEPTGHIDAVAHHLGPVPSRAVEVLQKAGETLGGRAADLIAPDTSIESMLLPAEGPSEVGFGALPPGAIPGAPDVLPADSHLGVQDTGLDLDGLLMRRPVEFGGLETLWQPLAPNGANSSSGGPADGPRLLPLAAIDSAGKRFATSTPIDGNGPKRWPGSPQGEAASAGTGSSFVPIAALLALAALAIFRRLGELADFRAPTSFVCALERPG